MRPAWILACAFAVLGGFLLALTVAWIAHVEADWLPYPAHVVGAAFAGLAIGRQGTPRHRAEPVVGAVVGIGLLAAIAFTSPHTFSWIAQRSDRPWLAAPAIAAGCALATAGGVWLANPGRVRPGPGSAAGLATLVTAALLVLGGRVVFAGLHVPTTMEWAVLVASGAAAIGAFATQWIVPEPRPVACTGGVVAVIALQIVSMVVKGYGVIDAKMLVIQDRVIDAARIDIEPSAVLLLAPALAALVGAHIALRYRPTPKTPADAF
jgi:hypothetical protein